MKYNNMNKLKFQTLILFIFLILRQQTTICPLREQTGSVHSGKIHLISARVTIAQTRSFLTLKVDRESQCLYYPLPYEFTHVPSIAISKNTIRWGIRDFISLPTDNLFLIIKPKRSQSKTSIPFLVRHPWRYSRWTKIVINLFVEDRSDI